MAPSKRIRNDFTRREVFAAVMNDVDICIPFLERILGVEIDHVVHHQTEREIKQFSEAKGVWLDVHLKTTDKVIDVEMQASRYPALGKRMRFYQAAMDTFELTEGMHYNELLESYVIFLCTYDPYKLGLPRYDIEPVCLQDACVDVGAQMHWVVLNSRAFAEEPSAQMRSLLQYVETGTVDVDDPLVSAIANKVAEVKERSGGMFWSVEDEKELWSRLAFKEGEEQGRVEGKAEGEALLSSLIDKLLNADRMDDVKRVVTDKAYRNQLLEEFALA